MAARASPFPCGVLRRRVHRLHENATFREARGGLHRLGNAGGRLLLQDDAVHHDVDEMLDLLVEHDRLALKAHDLAVDAHAREALFLQILQKLRELALPPDDDRRHDERAHPFAKRQDLIGDLVGGLLLDLAAALRAVRRAHAREQKAQVVVDLRGGAHGGARVLRGSLLSIGDGRRKAVDAVKVRLAHLAEELARVAGQALHVAALAFGVHGVEGQAGLARTRQSRDDHELVAPGW